MGGEGKKGGVRISPSWKLMRALEFFLLPIWNIWRSCKWPGEWRPPLKTRLNLAWGGGEGAVLAQVHDGTGSGTGDKTRLGWVSHRHGVGPASSQTWAWATLGYEAIALGINASWHHEWLIKHLPARADDEYLSDVRCPLGPPDQLAQGSVQGVAGV